MSSEAGRRPHTEGDSTVAINGLSDVELHYMGSKALDLKRGRSWLNTDRS